MKTNELLLSDGFGILSQVPYIGFELTKEQFELIKDKQCEFYEIDGKKLFPIKDQNGNDTGRMIAYIVFK